MSESFNLFPAPRKTRWPPFPDHETTYRDRSWDGEKRKLCSDCRTGDIKLLLSPTNSMCSIICPSCMYMWSCLCLCACIWERPGMIWKGAQPTGKRTRQTLNTGRRTALRSTAEIKFQWRGQCPGNEEWHITISVSSPHTFLSDDS